MMESGIVNIFKPAGMTSNDAICKLKRLFKPQKIGHLGTLDPSGTGVLPICINKATKLFDYYLKKDKEYRSIFVFGKETDTLDSDGVVIKTDDCDIKIEQLNDVLLQFVGEFAQLPPKYSAKKVGGKKAYDLARSGQDFELKPKIITIHQIEVVGKIAKNTFLFDIKCSSGTYIRSIARDVAQKLGTCAYMGAIIRTKSGNFCADSSVRLDDVSEDCIISLKNVLKDRQKAFICDKFYDKILNGCSVPVLLDDAKDVVAFCKGELIGIADISRGYLKVKTYLWEKND